jgi:hypothetical protein
VGVSWKLRGLSFKNRVATLEWKGIRAELSIAHEAVKKKGNVFPKIEKVNHSFKGFCPRFAREIPTSDMRADRIFLSRFIRLSPKTCQIQSYLEDNPQRLRSLPAPFLRSLPDAQKSVVPPIAQTQENPLF